MRLTSRLWLLAWKNILKFQLGSDVPILKFHLFYFLNENYIKKILFKRVLLLLLFSFTGGFVCLLLAMDLAPVKSKACL